MGQFQPVAGPSQDEFNALSGQVTALNGKIDFGMYSTLPTGLPTSGVVAFGLNSNVTLDGQFIPAGARFVGYMNNNIGHFTGVYNGEDVLALRYVAGTWSLLYSVNSKMSNIVDINNPLTFSSGTNTESRIKVVNKVGSLRVKATFSSLTNGTNIISNAHEKIPPATQQIIPVIDYDTGKILNGTFWLNGSTLTYYGDTITNKTIVFSLNYIIAN